jgi:hypothetical protein
MDSQSNIACVSSEETAVINQFVGALFEPQDIVCVRFIETWTEDGQKKSQVKLRRWLRAEQVVQPDQWAYLHEQAEALRANQFFGVCPRAGREHFDLACQVCIVRCLWADLDHCPPEEALGRCEAATMPKPSIVVSSGNGAHLYWLLDQPFLIDDAGPAFPIYKGFTEYRTQKGDVKTKTVYYLDEAKTQVVDPRKLLSAKAKFIQGIQQGMAQKLGGDHTQDLARILRLPGTLNRKDERNGKQPVPCTLVEINTDRRYAITEFECFHAAPLGMSRGQEPDKQRPGHRSISLDHLDPDQRETWERLLAECSDSTEPDRSSRDFKLLCHAVECDLDADAVWPLVESISKFEERGQDYFEDTWAKAAESVEQDRQLPNLEAEAENVVKSVSPAQKDVAWSEPLPLDRTACNVVPTFPIDAVKEIVPQYHAICQAVAHQLQVPIDLPALMGLSVMALPLAGRVRVAIRPGSFSPVVLWTLCALPPGERKTPAVERIKQPIKLWEEQEQKRNLEDIKYQKAHRKLAEKQKQAVEGEIKKEKDEAKIKELTRRYGDLDHLLAQPEPEVPRLLVDDATPEALVPFLHKHKGRAACLSDEAVFLEVALGRYSGNPHFELYLRGFDGGEYRPDRVGREHLYLPAIYLTLGLCIQVQPFLKLARDADAEHRGFFPRFLTAMPRSLMGHRQFVLDGDLEMAQAAWDGLIVRLLKEQTSRNLGHLPEGYGIIKEFETKYEPKLADNRELASLRAWVGKAVSGQMLRVAAVLHCASGEKANVIKPDTLRAAITVIEYFLAHTRQVHNAREEDMALDIAHKITDHLTRNKVKKFNYAHFKRHIWAAKNNEAALKDAYLLLQTSHMIRETSRTKQTVLYEVNPRLTAP